MISLPLRQINSLFLDNKNILIGFACRLVFVCLIKSIVFYQIISIALNCRNMISWFIFLQISFLIYFEQMQLLGSKLRRIKFFSYLINTITNFKMIFNLWRKKFSTTFFTLTHLKFWLRLVFLIICILVIII